MSSQKVKLLCLSDLDLMLVNEYCLRTIVDNLETVNVFTPSLSGISETEGLQKVNRGEE